MDKLSTKEKIANAIDNWNYQFKITCELLAIYINMSERTVKNHWIEFKDDISMINNKIRINNINRIKQDGKEN